MNRNASILICDDDEDDLYLVKSILNDTKFGKQTIYLNNGADLLEYLHSHTKETSIGLILLDLNMPKVDGREILKIIKTNPEFRKIPVIILTTSNSPQDIDKCYELGANCYMTKPSSYEGLDDAIKTLSKFWLELSHLPIKK
ncbi:response regulator receiver protein [Emticicia oligotrophica DSM 17448]|uniref:Response regulator receiver protein n=1 Tax=Emticicia oligotrophica (strain DSM 17448 / CIP 109782 / MTCC 6937 / GPTSA100-15) TaxID=929562 RepID=A0ABM5MYW4_EMTOG|nr:response regulator [Emticicia oligotrophica]AFK02319.1 response regulator receiver protein [Emticicia oligotrophica DSM 17448]